MKLEVCSRNLAWKDYQQICTEEIIGDCIDCESPEDGLAKLREAFIVPLDMKLLEPDDELIISALLDNLNNNRFSVDTISDPDFIYVTIDDINVPTDKYDC